MTGSVTGLFYGDAGQLVAQLIGVATLIGFVFTFSFVVNLVIDVVVGQRVAAKAELEGLDIPEMGALGYPEFVLKADAVGMEQSTMSAELVTIIGDALRHRPQSHSAGALARPSHGLAGGSWRLHPDARSRPAWSNPQSADLRTCLGMAYAMNYDVYKSMDALEAARVDRPDHFWAQLKYRRAALSAAGAAASRTETLEGLDLARNAWELSLARKQLQEIRSLLSTSTRTMEWSGPLWPSALAVSGFIAALLAVAWWM